MLKIRISHESVAELRRDFKSIRSEQFKDRFINTMMDALRTVATDEEFKYGNAEITIASTSGTVILGIAD